MEQRKNVSEITRRDLIRKGAGGALVIGGSAALLGCGSAASQGSSTAGGSPQRGGTLRIGLTGGASSDTFDPHIATTFPDYARASAVFEGLLGSDSTGRPRNLLAEEFSTNSSATEWTIRVKKGIEFQNGKELTAADVIYTLQRITNPKEEKFGAGSIQALNLNAIKKLDKYTIRIPTKQPFAILDQVISSGFTSGSFLYAIVPEGFDPKNPIGTGPFKYVSFTPNNQTVVHRNEKYWQHNLPYLDGVVITEYADEASQVNALIGGQEDAINSVAAASSAQIESGGANTLISDSGLFIPFVMRTDQEPFADNAVREAMKLIVDREQILTQVYGSHGTVGNDVIGIFSNEYDHTIPQREPDPEKAASLLKQAGASGASFELFTAPQAQGAVQAAEVLAQQASSAGLNFKLKKGTTTELLANYLNWPFTQTFWLGSPYLLIASLGLTGSAPFNDSHFDDSQYNSLFAKAVQTSAAAQRKQYAHDMQAIEYERGGYCIPFFAPVIDGYSSSVNGLHSTRSGLSLNDYVFTSVWLA